MITKKTALRKFLSSLYHCALDNRQLLRFQRDLDKGFSRNKAAHTSLTLSLQGNYLFGTDRGLFQASGSRVTSLLPYYTFGLTWHDATIYCAISIGMTSFIVAIDIHHPPDNTLVLGKGKILHQVDAKYHNERVHQLNARNGLLAFANTHRNAITVLDAKSGALISDIYPFNDATGFPIHTDHNHVNSVYLGSDCILFTAHNGGAIGSLIGVVHKDKVTAYAFPNRGIHDIIPTRDGITFSDTFGSSIKDFKGGGNLHYRSDWLLPKDRDKGFMIRGVAGTGDELIVGHSFMGKREDRFTGQGGMLVYKGSDMIANHPLPFAQVHDLIGFYGRKLDDEWSDITGEEAKNLFEKVLGAPIYQQSFSVLKEGTPDYTPGFWQS